MISRRFILFFNASWLIFMVALAACSNSSGNQIVYSHFETISREGWDPMEMLVFEPTTSDSSAISGRGNKYDVELILRQSASANIGKVPLVVTLDDYSGVSRSDTIVVDLSGEPEKSAIIKKHYGVKETTVDAKHGVTLTELSSISLSPLCRQEKTRGLLDVGIRISRINPN